MSALTDSVIIILQTTNGVVTDASIVTDPTGQYPQGIQAERVVLRGDSVRSAVLDLLSTAYGLAGGYAVPTHNDYQRKQLERIELLLTQIRDSMAQGKDTPESE